MVRDSRSGIRRWRWRRGDGECRECQSKSYSWRRCGEAGKDPKVRIAGRGIRRCENIRTRVPRGFWERAQKIFFDNLIFGKIIGKCVCCEGPPYRCKSKSKRRERRSKTMKNGVETSEKI